MRNIGDRHDESEAATFAFAIHGVVEILRGFAVDRHERQRHQVGATLAISRPHFGGQTFRLPTGRCVEFKGQIMLAKRNLNFNSRIGRASQHVLYSRDRFAMLGWLLENFSDDNLTGVRAVDFMRRNQQVLVDLAVLRFDEPDAALFMEPADNFAIGASEYVDDFALGTTAAVVADALGTHAIAVQNLAHLARRKEQIVAALVRYKEAKSIGVSLHGAGHEIELGGDAKLTLSVSHDETGALQLGQLRVEIRQRSFCYAEATQKLIQAERHTGSGQRGHNFLARSRRA